MIPCRLHAGSASRAVLWKAVTVTGTLCVTFARKARVVRGRAECVWPTAELPQLSCNLDPGALRSHLPRTRGRTHSWIRHILSGSLSFPRKQKQLKSNQIFQISLRVSLGLSDTATDNHNTDPGWWLWWWAPGSSRLGQASPKHAWSPRTQGSCLPHTLCPLPSSAWALRGNRIRSPV